MHIYLAVRQCYGLILMNFNKTALAIKFGVRKQDWAKAIRETAECIDDTHHSLQSGFSESDTLETRMGPPYASTCLFSPYNYG